MKVIMMTDRELLELAAKAADLIENNEGNFSGWECKYPIGWNPLTKDGDAFRLMIKLNLMNANLRNHAGKCKYSSMRRAIVRAAAEIGKSINNTKDKMENVLIPNFTNMDFVTVMTAIHSEPTIGKLVQVHQNLGSMHFLHSMTPQQARDMATALNNAANQLEMVL